MIRFLRYLIFLSAITPLGIEGAFAFQEEVDWIWNDIKPTARQGPVCMKYIVKAYPIRILRENVSGRTCLVNSIKSYRRGDHEEALGWILAGQCHNRFAREMLVKHAPQVLEYVLQRYEPEVEGK